MLDATISLKALTLGKAAAREKLDGAHYGIGPILAQKASGLEAVVEHFTTVFETVWDTLTRKVSDIDGTQFANAYSAFIASEIALEDLLASKAEHEANGGNFFQGRPLNFTGVRANVEDRMLSALTESLKYDHHKPFSNLLFDYFEWVNRAAVAESQKPGIKRFVEMAYKSKITVEGRKNKVFTGFQYERGASPAKSEPQLDWSDYGGYSEIVQQMKRIVALLNQPEEFFQTYGSAPKLLPKGILFAGPPGTGKTYLAKIFAQLSGLEYRPFDFSAFGSSLVNKTRENLMNEIEKAKQAIQEAYKKGVFLFFDEIESGVMSRNDKDGENNKVVGLLNNYMDGTNAFDGIFFGGASNRVDMMDLALIRPGRFELVVCIGVPDDETLTEIYKIHMAKKNKLISSGKAFADDIDLPRIVAASSNADYLAKLLPEQRMLVATGVIQGDSLDDYLDCVKAVAEKKVPEIRYNGMITGAVISGMMKALYFQKVTGAITTGHYEPITTQDILGYIAQRRAK